MKDNTRNVYEASEYHMHGSCQYWSVRTYEALLNCLDTYKGSTQANRVNGERLLKAKKQKATRPGTSRNEKRKGGKTK